MSFFPIFSPGTKLPVTVTFTATPNNGSALTTYTYTGVSFSTAAAGRKIVVSVHAGFGGTTVSTLTIGGISATFIQRANAGSNYVVEMWEATVPTGTTGTIVVTWNAGQNFCSVGVWAVYNAAATYSAAAVSSADPLSASVAIPANGCSIAAAHTADAATATWTTLTENYDERADPTTFAARMSGASLAFGAASSPTTTCTWTASAAPNMVLVSWGQA